MYFLSKILRNYKILNLNWLIIQVISDALKKLKLFRSFVFIIIFIIILFIIVTMINESQKFWIFLIKSWHNFKYVRFIK